MSAAQVALAWLLSRLGVTSLVIGARTDEQLSDNLAAADLVLSGDEIVPDPEGIITGGHDNKTARTMAIRQGEALDAPALTAMFKQIIANNRAGGWRKLKSGS